MRLGDKVIEFIVFFDQRIDDAARFEKATERCNGRKFGNGRQSRWVDAQKFACGMAGWTVRAALVPSKG